MRTSLRFVCLAGLAMLSCEGANRAGSVGDGGVSGDADADADGDSDADTDSDTGTATQSDNGCTSLDILFLIDNSPSMEEEQANLAKNFPKFIDVLDAYETPQHTKIDYRVGVTTCGVTRTFKEKVPGFPLFTMSSTGPNGKLQGKAACNLGAYPWVQGNDPEVSDKFSCMAGQGTAGSGNEMPLAAIELGLGEQSQDGGPNEGFYRKDGKSLLVIVIITDEDDCSIENGGTMSVGLQGSSDCDGAASKGLYDPAGTAGFIDDLAGGEGRYVVVGIGGAKQGGCTSAFGEAIHAKRLKEFVDLFGEHGVFGDVCSGDLWESLKAALDITTLTCDEFPPVE
ncbi:MAG: hypothetical protein PHU25_21995 [Deltaproteobacteria bacterium]|nr:hypothetical protein [Deltaproteobacteria bacterium]